VKISNPAASTVRMSYELATTEHNTYSMCEGIQENSKLFISEKQIKKIVACDHELSLNYFIQSLMGQQYVAYSCEHDHDGFLVGRCNGSNIMGYRAHKPQTPSSYYLHMVDEFPYEGKNHKPGNGDGFT